MHPQPPPGLAPTWLVGTLFRPRDNPGSAVAARILTDWHNRVHQFVKVMPRGYKRVLLAIRAAEESGADIDDAIMAASKG